MRYYKFCIVLKFMIYFIGTIKGSSKNVAGEAATAFYMKNGGFSNIDTESSDSCSYNLQEICFPNFQEFTVGENSGRRFLGRIEQSDLCKHKHLSYRLDNGTQMVELVQNQTGNFLYSKPYLNRESDKAVSDSYIFTISCKDGTRMAKKNFLLRIIDENDNPPKKVQHNMEENISLLATDNDSPDVNKWYTAKLFNLTELFTVKLQLQHINDSDYVSTGIYCDVTVKDKNKVLNNEYSTVVTVSDSGLHKSYGINTVNIPVKLIRIFEEKFVCERNTESGRLESIQNVEYNTEEPIILRSAAAPFTRIAHPISFRNLKNYKFWLNKSAPHMDAFNITKSEGIVYIQNISLLVHPFNSTEIQVFWKNEYNAIGSATLKIVVVKKAKCVLESQKDNWSLCSISDNRKTCLGTCGLGTGKIKKFDITDGSQGGCRWLNPGMLKEFNRNYSTCVADPDTCPDGYCDQLEMLHHNICLQDCCEKGLGHNGRKSELGIRNGIGTCTCNPNGVCSCFPNIPNSSKSKNISSKSKDLGKNSELQIAGLKSSNPGSTISNTKGNKCDVTCMTVIIAGSLLLSILVVLIVCRKMRLASTDKRNLKLGTTGIPMNSMDTLITTDPGQTPNDNLELIDPKWEFPRDNLEIESCLGEGEFGKVLRARAHNIAGIPGVTTVAVKTLKENAGQAELADLLSEYQMLKEISHPNVIRLLGASTTRGGPMYLIIEFAHHGSLKSYLRRHRRLEVRPGQENEPQPEDEVKPVDILSFSWQISKGMAYLADMKLVHRDLAARNILVASGKVCKVSDFGLTRDIYEDDTYLKRSKGRVPVKWMAIESLMDHVYTSKSDIWSFGILLWELVTLGSTPYPGIVVHNLYNLLRMGYRMKKPENCSQQLYDIMISCWQEDPMERPSFKQLTRKFELMLEDGTDYLDLNARFVYNKAYFTDLPELGDNLEYDCSTDNEDYNLISKKQQQKEKLFEKDVKFYQMVNGKSMSAHYANEKVTTDAYQSPKNNRLCRPQLDMRYVNINEK